MHVLVESSLIPSSMLLEIGIQTPNFPSYQASYEAQDIMRKVECCIKLIRQETA